MAAAISVEVDRLAAGPIIHPQLHASIGTNIQGPWQIHPPGSLQLAQSHFLTEAPRVDSAQRHQIEAAFGKRGIELGHDVVDEVTTPHIASPDVHVDEARQRIVMYYHGLESIDRQATRVAISGDVAGYDLRVGHAGPDVSGTGSLRSI